MARLLSRATWTQVGGESTLHTHVTNPSMVGSFLSTLPPQNASSTLTTNPNDGVALEIQSRSNNDIQLN